MLSSYPESIQIAFPQQWKTLQHSQDRGRLFLGEKDIEEGFAIFMENISEKHKFSLFIDDLGELRTDSEDRENLANNICSWTMSSGVKICAGSLPCQEFIETFARPKTQMIQLHLVNEPDIKAYCIKRFKDDQCGKKMNKELCGKAKMQTTDASQGVFLWAYLVIKQIPKVLRDALDNEEAITEALNRISRDLEDYYVKLLNPD